MPIEAWDVTAPADLDALKQGDDAIRQLKRAIDERMQRLADNWPDGDLLLKIKATAVGSTFRIESGPYANIPAATQDLIYYATDRHLFYVSEWDTSVYVWRVVSAAALSAAATPALGDLHAGQIALNTTDKSLYYHDGVAVSRVGAAAVYSQHQNGMAPGSRLTAAVVVQSYAMMGNITGGDVNGDHLVEAVDLEPRLPSFSTKLRSVVATAHDAITGAPLIAHGRFDSTGIIIRTHTNAGAAFTGTITFDLVAAYVA